MSMRIPRSVFISDTASAPFASTLFAMSVMLVTLGVKYMTGSVEAKADVKNNTVTYAIGAGIAFGATAIATIVKQFVLKNLG